MTEVDKASENNDPYKERKSKYEMLTAVVTLLSVIVGFIATHFQLSGQKNDLSRIEKSVERMPLEGIWDYDTHYSKYFGESDDGTHKHAHGKAAFVWYGNKTSGIYHVLMGGGVYEAGNTEPFATHVIDLPLEADSSGQPKPNSAMRGRYIARTSANKIYHSLSDQIVELRNLRIEGESSPTLIFTMSINDRQKASEGVVEFRRPPPQ